MKITTPTSISSIRACNSTFQRMQSRDSRRTILSSQKRLTSLKKNSENRPRYPDMAILPMLAFGIALLLVAVGIIGVFIPFVPGVPLAWLGLLLYAFATHFATISKTVLLIFLLVVALTSIVDFVAPLIG